MLLFSLWFTNFGRRQCRKYDVWPGDIDPENLPTWVCLKTGHKQAQSCIMDLPIIWWYGMATTRNMPSPKSLVYIHIIFLNNILSFMCHIYIYLFKFYVYIYIHIILWNFIYSLYIAQYISNRSLWLFFKPAWNPHQMTVIKTTCPVAKFPWNPHVFGVNMNSIPKMVGSTHLDLATLTRPRSGSPVANSTLPPRMAGEPLAPAGRWSWWIHSQGNGYV